MREEWWVGRSVWVSGSTGAWGKEIVKQLLALPVRRILAFARGEHRAADLYESFNDDRLRVRLGDIRDGARVRSSMSGADVVIHAAALKRVDTITYNAVEIVRTNVEGTINVLESCVEHRPEKALLISSDKAVMPTNLYGSTKMTAEHLWLAGNGYAPGPRACRFAVLRSGNALGSTGSVLHIWKKQRAQGKPLTLTHPEMSRFHITLSDAIRCLLTKIEDAQGGEVFLPEMPSYFISELAQAFAPGYPIEVIGVRDGGEKLHEVLEVGGVPSDRAVHLGYAALRGILATEGWL